MVLTLLKDLMKIGWHKDDQKFFSNNGKIPKVHKNCFLIKGKVQDTLDGFLKKKKPKNKFFTHGFRYLSINKICSKK